MPLSVRVETVTGAALVRQLPTLARRRATVFRSWPYLYEAELGYEDRYQEAYAASPGAGLVLAWAGDEAVGASTCLPLADETVNVQAPFVAYGFDPQRFFYFGESVVLPGWRGLGIGVAFFQHREAHAVAVSDAAFACFCAVQRPADHPARPKQETTLDGFWEKRGYVKRPDLRCRMAWRDVGDAAETEKVMMFWVKSLRGAPLP